MLLMISMVKKLLEHYEKELQKTNQQEFRIEKVIKKKGNKLYVKWKVMIILLMVGLMKKIQCDSINLNVIV